MGASMYSADLYLVCTWGVLYGRVCVFSGFMSTLYAYGGSVWARLCVQWICEYLVCTWGVLYGRVCVFSGYAK
jgi:hypothetical protein